MRRWWKRRPLDEYFVFAEAMAALTVTRLALYCVPLRLVWRGLSTAASRRYNRPLPLRRVIRCAEAAVRFSPVPMTCLAKALVFRALLSRHGHTTRMRIGVRRNAGGPLAAHAWLEHEGAVIVGGPPAVVEQYQALPEMEHLIA